MNQGMCTTGGFVGNVLALNSYGMDECFVNTGKQVFFEYDTSPAAAQFIRDRMDPIDLLMLLEGSDEMTLKTKQTMTQ